MFIVQDFQDINPNTGVDSDVLQQKQAHRVWFVNV